MKNKFTVSIGIPAYNEQANIKNLLVSLLSQNQDNFELTEIIVASDGSTDNTVSEVQSVTDLRVVLINDGQRKGQAGRQNDILQVFKGEILILINADVLPKNNLFLHFMVEPFYNNPRLGIVSNDGIPLPAKNFFEKAINFSVAMRHEIILSMNQGNNIYMCHGLNRAFSKDFSKNFTFGPAVSEDAYSYFKCLEMGLEFFYQPKAELYYRSPQNLKDHLRQSVRFFQGNKMLGSIFGQEKVASAFRIPTSVKIKAVVKYFFKNPILFTYYFCILILANLKSLSPQKNETTWEPSASSKSLS